MKMLTLNKFAVFTCLIRLCSKILLHDPKETPMMIERGLKVSAGFAAQIAVHTKEVRLKKSETWLLYTLHVRCICQLEGLTLLHEMTFLWNAGHR